MVHFAYARSLFMKLELEIQEEQVHLSMRCWCSTSVKCRGVLTFLLSKVSPGASHQLSLAFLLIAIFMLSLILHSVYWNWLIL
jgi:hypothetical protein